VLKKLFGSEKVEMDNLGYKKFHNVYRSLTVLRRVKSRRFRWVGHVVKGWHGVWIFARDVTCGDRRFKLGWSPIWRSYRVSEQDLENLDVEETEVWTDLWRRLRWTRDDCLQEWRTANLEHKEYRPQFWDKAQTLYEYVRFEVLTAVRMTLFLWVVTPCKFVGRSSDLRMETVCLYLRVYTASQPRTTTTSWLWITTTEWHQNNY
jgi:hypothetical protein